MKKIISILLIVMLLVSSFSISAFATESSDDTLSIHDMTNDDNTENTNYESDYVVSSVVRAKEIDLPVDYSVPMNRLSAEEVIKNSTNVQAKGTTVSGSYKSGKMDAGLPGYKYRISFDWTAKVNSNGDYIFNTLTNPLITTYENWFILGMTWSMYFYDITKCTYGISSDRTYVTFNTDYEFVVYDDYGFDYTFPEPHVDTIYMEDLL